MFPIIVIKLYFFYSFLTQYSFFPFFPFFFLLVQSIITQVSRDQPPQTPPTPHALTTRAESKPLSTGAAPSNPNYPPQRRNFFQRLLCCAPKSGPSHHNAGVLPSNSSFILTKKASFGSQKSQGSDYGFLSTKTDNKKCLALDLDETLVHSSFQPVDCASFVISVTIEGICHSVYVIKRPGVDEFLERMAEHYEVSIFLTLCCLIVLFIFNYFLLFF